MTPRARHAGPPLVALAVIHIVLFVGGVIAVAALAGGDRFPSPTESESDIVRFFANHARQTRWAGALYFGAAFPLGLFTATVVSRLRYLGISAAGATIALFGGIGASLALLACGGLTWTLAVIGPMNDATAAIRAVHLLTFVSGGPATIALSGLLVAGVAVTAGLSRLVPAWVAWVGVLIAIVSELSTLVLLWPGAMLLLPIARFPGLLWLVLAGALLPTSRPDSIGVPST